ncbi:MarR family winged helix-turn-helix transcriptional regulator [Zongyangia hominis]|uniref:MarR family transcriptional regulator n=1 Tax=Zongyangia hominis TaxID=2763677 RepID=A0A926IAQ0_9FIRM|nr:MarR family transcriptional regulator [Zongyangia hominis]MBC8569340.1 MarR family transcriptional regulator [Zongyangia hominis]
MSDQETAQRLVELLALFGRANTSKIKFPGIKTTELNAIVCIKSQEDEHQEGIKTSDIGRLLGVTPPSITPVINSLEEQGYVTRLYSKLDRRVVRVKLTDRGEAVYEEARELMIQKNRGLMEYLGHDDSRQFVRILQNALGYMSRKN